MVGLRRRVRGRVTDSPRRCVARIATGKPTSLQRDDPQLVDELPAFHSDAAFWSTLRPGDLTAFEPADRLLGIDQSRLDQIATAFAQVIDAKSPYTHRHSERVSE